VPTALLQISAAPGGALAGRVAAAWVVADQTGCGLARPLARLHHAVHTEERLREEVIAQLAGPRVTARLLAALPLVGVALGVGLGADPVGFLVGTPVGLGCTVLGLTLIATGMWWTSRITASVAATYCADP
jgi:tight adherence protein B